ncbi:MAG TPA: phage tail tape measure C-terminal domain-containing protein [Acidobacteriaceae bacterium]|nr:phage tail tape measure C-terminal domain-containing protein [Acidobacteriaceae bacterium]
MAGKKGIEIVITADPSTTKAALEQIREQMKETAGEAKHSAGETSEAWERAKTAIEYMGLYEGFRMAAEGVRELIGGSMELGETLKHASEQTGLTIDSLSTLHYAAAVLGTDFEGLVTGVARMGKNLSEAATGNKNLAADFAALGLNAKDLASRTDGSEIAFHKLVQTLAATESSSARNRLAMDMLGKAGVAQIPMLIEIAQHWDEYKARAEEAGVQLNGETAKALEETQQRFNDLKEHVHGAGLEFTEGLVPGLDQMMDVIRDGKTDRQVFLEWGRDLSRVMAAVAAGFYSAAAGKDYFESIARAGELTASGRAAEASGDAYAKKADEFRAIAMGDPTKADVSKFTDVIRPSDLDSWAQGDGTKPFVPPTVVGDGTKKSKEDHSQNGIASAAAALVAEQAKAAADAQKNADTVELARNEAQHKQLLISDQAYYAEKLRLETDALNAEEVALQKKQTALQSLLEKQHKDKTLKRDKNGHSAEEDHTQTELLRLQEEIGNLEARKKQLKSAAQAETATGAQAAELDNLRAAAELEKQRNDGITAQLALLQRETELEARKLQAQGGSAGAVDQVRALGDYKAKQLEIGDVERQIQQQEESYKLKAQAIEDRASKGQESKLAAERELNALHQQEASALESLVEQYDALAQTLGGPFKEKAAELHAELAKLQTPDKSKEPDFGKTLSKGVTSMADRIAEETMRGKTSFKQMAQEMEQDALKLAMKLLEMKLLGDASGGASGAGAAGGGGFLSSMFSSIFGAAGMGHASGTSNMGGAAVVGERGPELWVPPQKGGSVIPASLTSKLAESGGGKMPSVTTNVINQSSQPVSAQPSQVSYDSQLREFVIHTVLTDHSQNGPIAQSMMGFGQG